MLQCANPTGNYSNFRPFSWYVRGTEVVITSSGAGKFDENTTPVPVKLPLVYWLIKKFQTTGGVSPQQGRNIKRIPTVPLLLYCTIFTALRVYLQS